MVRAAVDGASVGLSTLSQAPQLRGQLDTASGKLHQSEKLITKLCNNCRCANNKNTFTVNGRECIFIIYATAVVTKFWAVHPSFSNLASLRNQVFSAHPGTRLI
jgi:hypothetical protein